MIKKTVIGVNADTIFFSRNITQVWFFNGISTFQGLCQNHPCRRMLGDKEDHTYTIFSIDLSSTFLFFL